METWKAVVLVIVVTIVAGGVMVGSTLIGYRTGFEACRAEMKKYEKPIDGGIMEASEASEAAVRVAPFRYHNVRLDLLEKLCKEMYGRGELLTGNGNSVVCVIPGTAGNAFYKVKVKSCSDAGGSFLGQTPGLDLLCDLSTVGL